MSRQVTAEVAIQPNSPFGADHLPAFHGVWVFSVGDGRRMPYYMTRFPDGLLVCSEVENALIRGETASVHGEMMDGPLQGMPHGNFYVRKEGETGRSV